MYKRLARSLTNEEHDAKRRKVADDINPELEDMIRELKGFDAERLNLIKTLAVGLTAWIKDGIEGEKRLVAAKRILECYLAQLEGKTDETVTKLDLSELGLKSLPPEIGKLTNLTALDLFNNQLTSIEGLEKLTNLTGLCLDDNQLTSVEGVEKLTNLRGLSLSNNQLTSVEEVGKLTNLTGLELENNKLISLPAEIGNLTNLGYLNLTNNQLTSLEGLEKLTNLRGLSLSNNQLTSLEGVEKLTNLIELNLANNQLTSVEEVGKLTNLIELNLANNQLTSIEGLEKLTNLTGIWLDNNYLPETESGKLPEHMRDLDVGQQKGKKELEIDIEKILKYQQSNIATLIGKREVTGKSCSHSLQDSVSLLHLIRIRNERGWGDPTASAVTA